MSKLSFYADSLPPDAKTRYIESIGGLDPFSSDFVRVPKEPFEEPFNVARCYLGFSYIYPEDSVKAANLGLIQYTVTVLVCP